MDALSTAGYHKLSFMHPDLKDTEEKEVNIKHLTVDLDKNKRTILVTVYIFNFIYNLFS